MKKTIAVFFGGQSPEHDISIVTAISAVIKPLELTGKYTVVPIYITKKGQWYTHDLFKDIAVFRSKAVDELCAKLKPLGFVIGNGLILEKSLGLRRRERINVDIAFPAMHGGFGEDGSLMGLLRMAGIPFVGNDMQASVIAMDKVLAKQVAEANAIPVAKYQYIRGNQFAQNPDNVTAGVQQNLTFPLFVKPAHLGSSIGISRVTDPTELKNAIEVAVYYDEKVIIEEAVNNLIEVTVPLMGNDEIEAALVERPLSGEGEFFDFDTKYINGGKKTGAKSAGAQGYSELPADLPAKLYNECVETAKAVYRAVECSGTARVDLLIDSKTETVYFNEVNPLPGSLYAHNWRQAGVSSMDLVSRLVDLAEEQHEKQQKLERTFTTSFLKQF